MNLYKKINFTLNFRKPYCLMISRFVYSLPEEDYMKKPKKISLTIFRYLILIILFIGAFYLIKWFYDSLTTDEYVAPVTPVEVTKAEYMTLDKSLVISGYIEAKDIVPVSPYLDGTIVEFNIQPGDIVKEGDVVARIDPEPYRLQLEQAEAAYAGYSSSFERVKPLYEQNIATKQEYDTLKAQTDAAKAQLELAKLQLSYTDVVAHASGTVQKTLSAKGSTAVKGTPIAIISDLDNLVINVKVGEKYFDLFNDNPESLKIKVVRPASDFSKEVVSNATISYVSPYIDPTSKNFAVQISIDDNKGSFKPGMYVKTEIIYAEESGYALPVKTMKLDGSAYYVDENGKAAYVDFSDAFKNNEYFLVPNDLKQMSFISNGKDSVIEGMPVNVIGESEK